MVNCAEGPTRLELYKKSCIPRVKDFLAWLDGKELSIRAAQDTLNAVFIGQEFDSRMAPYSIAARAEMLMRGSPFHEEPRASQIYEKRVSSSEVALTYKGRQIAQIYYKKKKAKPIYACDRREFIYVYSTVFIQEWPRSVKAAFDQIDELELKEAQKKAEKEKDLGLLSKIFPMLEGDYPSKFAKLRELANMESDGEAIARLKQ